MLGGEENLLVTRHRFFERAHARFPAHNERRHHVREDHDVPNGHHRQASGIGFFFRGKHRVNNYCTGTRGVSRIKQQVSEVTGDRA